MGFRQPHIPTLLGHLFAALALSRCHCGVGLAHAIAGNAANNAAKVKAPTLQVIFNSISVASTVR
jgi:hypothetical protein